MIDLPYQSYINLEQDKIYHVMLTYLPLEKYRFLPQFLYFVYKIVRQLSTCPGLVGYTLSAGLFTKVFYTMSIWENEKKMKDFIIKAPHITAVADLQGKMGKTAFFQWVIPGYELPLTWAQVLQKTRSTNIRDFHKTR